MNAKKFADAMSELDTKYVDEALCYKKKARKPVWVKWGAVAACLCLMLIVAIPVVNFFTDYQADDPNWEKTHYETSALSEIEAVCGTDLLIDKVAQVDKGFRNYHLEIVENGSFENKADWKSLTIEVNYGNSLVDSTGDSVLCFISFDGNTDGIYIEDYLTETATMEINGHTVEYREASLEELAAENINYGHKQEYHGWAKFTHNGYEYYIATDSDNPDFFEMTLEHLLK